MATELDQTQTVEMNRQPETLRTVDELAEELASITGRTFDEMKLEILSLNPLTYEFRGVSLISPGWADATIDHYAEQLKARLRTVRPALAASNGEVTVETTAVAVAEPIPASVPTVAKKTPTKGKTTAKAPSKRATKSKNPSTA